MSRPSIMAAHQYISGTRDIWCDFTWIERGDFEVSDGLSSWKQFELWVSAEKRWNDGASRLARANARYRASKYLTFTAEDPSKEYKTDHTPAGYAILVEVALAYSALESVEDGMRKFAAASQLEPPSACEIFSAKIASDFRRKEAEGFRKGLRENLTNHKLLEAISNIGDGVDDNIRPVMQGVRHLVFHGFFAPATIGLRKPFMQTLLFSLKEVTLDASDARFSEWIDDLGIPDLKPVE